MGGSRSNASISTVTTYVGDYVLAAWRPLATHVIQWAGYEGGDVVSYVYLTVKLEVVLIDTSHTPQLNIDRVVAVVQRLGFGSSDCKKKRIFVHKNVGAVLLVSADM